MQQNNTASVVIMNLTINTQSKSNKPQKKTSHVIGKLLASQKQQQFQRLFSSGCPRFALGECLGHREKLDISHGQILLNYPKQCLSAKQETRFKKQPKFAEQPLNRKQKICLSLRQSRQKYQTAEKRERRNLLRCKIYCQNKLIQHQSKQKQRLEAETNGSKRILSLKIKTEPGEDLRQTQMNSKLMKASLKLSTNIMTPTNKSLKQSNFSTAKKFQLTLSNSFKSSMDQERHQFPQKIYPNVYPTKKAESSLVSQQVQIDQSSTTAKLYNIYGEIQKSYLQHPSNYIVCQNEVSDHEAVLKRPETLTNSELDNSSFGRQKKMLTKKEEAENTSILRGFEDESQERKSQPLQNAVMGIRQNSMERRYIGDYANTIKTFNESDFNDQESFVLEHGIFPKGSYQFINGSIQECPREPKIEIIRRQRGLQQNQPMPRDRFREYFSHPIEESSYDAQRDF